jgi:hypothetical protein
MLKPFAAYLLILAALLHHGLAIPTPPSWLDVVLQGQGSQGSSQEPNRPSSSDTHSHQPASSAPGHSHLQPGPSAYQQQHGPSAVLQAQGPQGSSQRPSSHGDQPAHHPFSSAPGHNHLQPVQPAYQQHGMQQRGPAFLQPNPYHHFSGGPSTHPLQHPGVSTMLRPRFLIDDKYQ